jgi:YD repeat-containing protein
MLDNVGNRTRMVDSEGTTNYTYDALYRLSNFQSPTSNIQYTYDAMGNRATMVNSVSGTTNYTYDNADRLLTAGATAFTWDNNGNQLTKGAATYAYDVANRLTQVVNGGTTVQYAYDGDGKRASKTVNGTATSYAYDVNAALPVVLTETTSGIATTYLYGTDLLARYDNAGTPTYYHADGLGSVRALSNSAGQSVATYNYDAFGAVRQARSSLRGSRWMMRWG